MDIPFTKMHGLGNDHLVINMFETELPDTSKLAPIMCHRHLGIGADGLILVGPSDEYDFSMRVINSDGTESEMCGNGIRCLARYVFENGMTNKTTFVTESLRGPHTQEIHTANGQFIDVTTEMGEPRLKRSLIPMTGDDSNQVISEALDVGGRIWNVTLVNVGNPHCVVFVDDVDSIDLPSIGPKFENHDRFPNRINTEFIQVLDRNNLRMRVWERGCGETMACGTGATASVVAAILNGYTFDTVMVHLAYGDLIIEWRDRGQLYMTGGATHICTGLYRYVQSFE